MNPAKWDTSQAGWKTKFSEAKPPITRAWPNCIRWQHYAEQRPEIGDIAFFTSDGTIGRLIRDETKSWVNHVARIVAFDNDGCPLLMDAQPRRVQLRRLDAYVGDFLAIYSPICSDEKREAIVERTRRFEGDPYGYGKVLLIKVGLGNLCTIDGFPICSYTVAVPSFEEGQTFGVRAKSATPAHLWDYVRAHPEHYTRKRPLQLLEAFR